MLMYPRPLSEVAATCELSPLPSLTAREGNTLALGWFDEIGTAAMAAAAASNAMEIADGKRTVVDSKGLCSAVLACAPPLVPYLVCFVGTNFLLINCRRICAP